MKTSRLSIGVFLVIIMAATSHAAPITNATFNLDPGSVAADADQDGSVDNPLSFTSITVGGTVYSVFTYGTAFGPAGNQYFYTPGEDPGDELLALGGAIVTDGVLNNVEGTQVRFNRPITAEELIFVTDVNGDEDSAALWLIDSTNNRIAGTGVNFGSMFAGGNSLVTFEGEGSTGSVFTASTIWGAAFSLSDFNGYSGSDAWGVEFGSGGSTFWDPSIVGLAAIPEPGTIMMVLGGSGLLLLRRRRG